MTLSIDDLVKVFRNTAWPIPTRDGEGSDIEGIRAVVTALRDEFRNWIDADKMFNEILGGLDAGDEAAGGSTREDGQACNSSAGSSPAAAPDDVCVWTPEEYVTHSTSCGSEQEVDPRRADPTYCSACGKPIKFVEAAR